MKWFSSTTFALFRIIFGTYLLVHFIHLLPVSEELFSNQGVINSSTLLPSYGKLPLHIFKYDDPLNIRYFVISLIVSSGLFTIGILRRVVSLWLFYGWMCLLNRNPLISNPSIGYIGWLLLACALIPSGERLGFLQSEKDRKEYYKKYGRWEVPSILYHGMWLILGISYTASGVHKLQCPSWLNGTALYYVLSGPLAYQNNIIVELFSSNANFIQVMTLGSLVLELSALFFGTFSRTRCAYWVMFMGFHVGILMTISFADLTIGMLIPHLFTFDPSWFSVTRKLVERYDWADNKLIDHDINHTDHFNENKMHDNYKKVIEELTTKSNELSSKNNATPWIIIVSIIIAITGIGLGLKGIDSIQQLACDMYWGFGSITMVLGVLMILERIFPDQKLKKVDGWWRWVLIINLFQLFAVVLASFTWEIWLQDTNYFKSSVGFHLRDHVSPFTGGLIAYIITQWLFYWWHRARHEVYFLWILFHQFHHSPSRIETITSFYKHPLEIIVDSQILAILLYSVLGLTNESSIWLSIFSAIGEYLYHMNIKTLRLMGYFFQRPESHRCHHRRNKRLECPNYSDLPLWDILGRTFENPQIMDEPTGFTHDAEIDRIGMLMFKDVITGQHQDIFSDFSKFRKVVFRYLSYALVIWGSLNALAFIVHNDGMRDIGFATVSSPLPLVFSAYNGIETFATEFNVTIVYKNGTIYQADLDPDTYRMMGGAYNRRNIYGAVFSHGPFFDKENLIKIRQSILYYAVCNPGSIMRDFKIHGDVLNMHVDVLSRTNPGQKIGNLSIQC